MTKQKIKIVKLENLDRTQLGKLFPIEIVPYNRNWPALFRDETSRLIAALGNKIVLRIEHFGSTAVEGLAAKPVIDILMEIPPLTIQLKKTIVSKMEAIGYHFIWRADEPVPYMNFVKGYTASGTKGDVFHVHMADCTHPLWDRIFFRDYLRQNKDTAEAYEALKLSLALKFRNDREAYTNGKSKFINNVTRTAKEIFSSQDVSLLKKLGGGDLRSIAGANEIASAIRTQNEFNKLFACLLHPDRKIVMRTADAIEKITRTFPLFLEPHKTAIFSLCTSADHIELKWHLAQLLPRIPVSEKEFMWVWNCLAGWAINTKESRIVRANSFEGLFILLKTRIEMKPDFERMLTKIIDENIPSLNARIKKLKLHYHL